MPNQKISELTTIVTVDNAVDLFPIVDTSANTTKKITPTALKSALALDNVNNTSDANKPVSTAQQDALNAKVTANAAIVAATKTKITYDAKGLVTAGDILDASDMPTGINAANIGAGQVSSTEFGYLDGVTSAIQTQLDSKQATLVSGTNIKTINSTSLVGAGDVAVQPTLVSGTNIKTINSTSLLGSGDITISANPSGVAGAIQFSNGSAFASDASNLFWDDTNNRLGIGTNAPISLLHVFNSSFPELTVSDGTVRAQMFANTGGASFIIGTATSHDLVLRTAFVSRLRITSTGNIGVGEDTPTAKLQVKGSGSTSATTSLLVQNSAGTNLLQVRDDNSIFIPREIFLNSSGAATLFARNNNGAGFAFGFNNTNTSSSTGISMLESNPDWFCSSGFEFATFRIQPRYDFNANTTSAAIARGIYYNPTLTNLRVANHYAWQNTSGAMIVNSTTPQASAVLQADSTTQGFLPPRMTTTQKTNISSPAAGLVVYDTTLGKLCVRTASAWETITSV
jgi:hypothetical protein